MDYQQLHKGHLVFENQPPSSCFDKSFQDSSDALYLHLNEIDPYFLHESPLPDAEQSDENNGRIMDPRLKKEVEIHEIDHSDEHCGVELFDIPLRSCLNQKQHAAGIRVLRAWQESGEVENSDFQTWLKMARYLQAERQRMRKYVEDYAQKHKAIIYECTKRFLAIYQHWYANEVQTIIKRFPENLAYNTIAGLPNVQSCKPLEDELRARPSDTRILARAGYLRVHNKLEMNYKVLFIKLETYAQKHISYIQNQKEYFDRSKISAYLQEAGESHTIMCYLPLGTLLYLLMAGEFIDLPTEALLQIESKENGQKCIYFENPLPARNCGWHTNQQVVQQVRSAQMSLDSKIEWLHFENDKITAASQDHYSMEAGNGNLGKKEFKVEKLDDFMQAFCSQRDPESGTQSCLKTNETLVSWKLETYNEEADKQPCLNYIQMLTKLELPAAQNSNGQQFYGSDDIKLEYKPAMGCEVLTKYELLKLWWQLELNESAANHAQPLKGLCTRLSAHNFELLLQERLTRGQVEQYLFEQHHLRMPQILVKLHEFLKMLSNMSTGHYMIRFNPKYAEKLLLCAPTVDINTNTIYLHNLLDVTPSDICFMTASNMCFPLAENLCSRLHLKHNILPCTFPPATNEAKQKKKVATKKLFFNDRDLILQRVQQVQVKIQAKETARASKRKTIKRAKKVKKRQERKATKEVEAKEQLEYEKDILNDEILFG